MEHLPAMDDDTLPPFSLPAVRRKKVSVAFEAGPAHRSSAGVAIIRARGAHTLQTLKLLWPLAVSRQCTGKP